MFDDERNAVSSVQSAIQREIVPDLHQYQTLEIFYTLWLCLCYKVGLRVFIFKFAARTYVAGIETGFSKIG